MEKNKNIGLIVLLLTLVFHSCCKDEETTPSEVLGTITVSLDARKVVVRTREAAIGNFVCDAIKSELDRRGELADFVLMNGGAIRFNEAKRPNGIYPGGQFTSDMIDEMIPFGNSNVIVSVSGKELKNIFERSVAQLPQAVGPFLQLSGEIRIVIDTLGDPQVINELVEPPQIISPGSRIVSIFINGVSYDSLGTYLVCVPDFIAEQSENDGYVTFRLISSSKKENLGDNQADVVKQYIKTNSPVTPVLDGRIKFQ